MYVFRLMRHLLLALDRRERIPRPHNASIALGLRAESLPVKCDTHVQTVDCQVTDHNELTKSRKVQGLNM